MPGSGEGNGTLLQYSCLENPMEGGAWWAAAHGVAKCWTRLSNFTLTFHFNFSLPCIGEGNGNPLQCSCLENPRDEGAWWAAIYGVAQSWTRLKQLSSSSRATLCNKGGDASQEAWTVIWKQTNSKLSNRAVSKVSKEYGMNSQFMENVKVEHIKFSTEPGTRNPSAN